MKFLSNNLDKERKIFTTVWHKIIHVSEDTGKMQFS